MGEKLSLSAVWCYVIAGVVSFVLAAFLILCLWVFPKIKDLTEAIGKEDNDSTLKAIISGSVAVSLLYVCLFLSEPIKEPLISLNIFSIRLLLSLMGGLLVNLPEIIKGTRHYFKYGY